MKTTSIRQYYEYTKEHFQEPVDDPSSSRQAKHIAGKHISFIANCVVTK